MIFARMHDARCISRSTQASPMFVLASAIAVYTGWVGFLCRCCFVIVVQSGGSCANHTDLISSSHCELVILIKQGLREYGLGWFGDRRCGMQVMGVFRELASRIAATEGNVVSCSTHAFSQPSHVSHQAVICENGRTRSASIIAAYLLTCASGDGRELTLVKNRLNTGVCDVVTVFLLRQTPFLSYGAQGRPVQSRSPRHLHPRSCMQQCSMRLCILISCLLVCPVLRAFQLGIYDWKSADELKLAVVL